MTAALAAFFIAAAAAAPSPVHRWVLLVETDAASRPGVSIDASARTATRFRVGAQFLSPEEAFVEGGREAESGLSACGADASCFAARLRHVRADFALLLIVRRVAGEDLIALRVVKTQTGEVVHRAVAPAKQLDQIGPAVSKVTAAALDALGYGRGGELVVTVQPNNAELVAADGVTDLPLTAGRATLLPARSYTVRARLAGFADAVAKVDVAEGGTQNLALTLSPREELTDEPWFWVGIGVAATALGVAIGVAAAGSERCFCAAADPNACGSCP